MNGESWASSPRARNVMRGNRSRDTLPELRLRRASHALGLRYRVDARPVSGLRRSADLVFTRAKVAVFVDGCYWHGCPAHYVASKTNASYWHQKIAANVNRDAETNAALIEAGWLPVRVWAHEDMSAVAAGLARLIEERRRTLAARS